MTYKADYPYRIINPYSDKKAKCQMSDYTRPDYPLLQGLIIPYGNISNAFKNM